MKGLKIENFAKYKFLLLIFCLLLLGQPAAMAAEGTVSFTVVPSPLSVSVSAPDSVYEGKGFKVEARVTNSGQTKIKEAAARIEIDPPSGILVRGKDEKGLGTISRGGTKTVTWWMKAAKTGEYNITVSACGRDELTGTLLTAGDTATIEVKGRSAFLTLHLTFLLISKALGFLVK